MTCGIERFADNHRRKKVTERRPRGIRPFIAIEWFFTGSTFTPTIGAVCVRHTH
jgi:hypothetical protein